MTWTGQNFSVGQVLTAAQMNNLQADITAAMSGDAGAPQLAIGAFPNDLITPIKMASYGSGNYIISDGDVGGVTTSTTYVKVGEYVTNQAGTINSIMGIYESGKGSGTVYGRVYVNGSAVGTERSTNNTTETTFTEDVTVSTGDLVQLYLRAASGVECTGTFKLGASAGTAITPGQEYTI